jgi:glycosyltransferase involved in cell wall biosynthesis
MNKGVAAATGDVVCFLNSDDVYASNDVLATVAAQMTARNLDALYGDVGYFRTGAPERISRRYSSRSFHPDRLAYGVMPAHPALFLRRSIFQRVGEFRRDYRIAGDFEFIVRVFRQRITYAYLPEILVKMRIGGISTSGWKSRILLNREILQACRDNGIGTNIFKLAARYPMKALELFRR